MYIYLCLESFSSNVKTEPILILCRVFNSRDTQTRSTRQLNKGHVWSDTDGCENGCLPFTVNQTTLRKWLIKGIIHPKLKRHPFTTRRQGRWRLWWHFSDPHNRSGISRRERIPPIANLTKPSGGHYSNTADGKQNSLIFLKTET